MLLPAITAAILGAEDMIGSTWVLTMVALGVLTYRQTGSASTTFWYVAVWGAALAGAVVSIHLVVTRYLAGMRVADALRRVAEHEVNATSWPGSLTPCLPHIADALEADRVDAVVCGAGGELTPLAGWPDVRPEPALAVAEALEVLGSGRPRRRGNRLLVPVVSRDRAPPRAGGQPEPVTARGHR